MAKLKCAFGDQRTFNSLYDLRASGDLDCVGEVAWSQFFVYFVYFERSPELFHFWMNLPFNDIINRCSLAIFKGLNGLNVY